MNILNTASAAAADVNHDFRLIEPTEHALIDRFYRAQGYKVKCGASERVYTMTHANKSFIAAARLVPQSSGHFWLRNVLVASDWRGQGIATGLIQTLLPDLKPKGCYCFALPHLTDFYTALGFVQHPAHCPEDILRTYTTYRSRGRDWVLMGYIQG